ncbi:MAG: protein translocase subunit SecD [Verrucomicrobiota bacterium]|nr:protein translocase subunit SecD [Verrucomicrobiota bacterium]
MNRNNTWKWILVILVVLWAISEFTPPGDRNLIEEFNAAASNRDTNFTAIVAQARELEKQNPNRSYGHLRQAIGTNDISRYFPDIKLKQGDDATRTILTRIQRNAAGKIKLGLDLKGGTSFLVGMDTSVLRNEGETNAAPSADRQQEALSQAIEVLRKRVDKFGVAEPVLQPSGENRILIQLPGLSEADIQEARATIEKAAFLEFRLVHPESDQLISQGLGAPGYEKLMLREKKADGSEFAAPFLVKRKAELGLTGKYVSRAGVTRDPVSNTPEIILNFDSEGAQKFGEITQNNVGRLLAIVLDGELYSAPRINGPIMGGSASISGDFDLKEAFTLANVLENPLEAPVKIQEQRGVDPSLGADSIRNGVRASIIGIVAVAAFMIFYYLLAGVISIFAVLLNVIITLGVLCSVGTTLTLPGIAGIVLTVGMAVDANVLIYERIREELAAGKSLRGALAAGYDKAFGTIFDSNITTLIASIILIFMGTGPVKGFGVTLTIGVMVTMFTALVVTRLIFDWLLAKNMISTLKMMQFIKGANFDFMKWAKPAFALSWALILIGIGYGIYRGKDAMGVDFIGGDSLTLRYEKKIPVEQLRSAVDPLKVGDVGIQYQEGAIDASRTLQVTTAFDTGFKVEEALIKAFPDAKFSRVQLDKVGAVIGAEILKSAIIAAMLAMFGILVYVAFRYEFSFAVGAVVAIIHDVLMTMAWFFLTDRELSAPIVAAILTIIGFSINDTIVIFDRIREDLKLGVRGSFREIMNGALNRTLSRTIITSGTVFLATLSLYLFGGGVINDFAFTFLVGILTGSYSSIYIASALVLWWHKGERPKTSSSIVVDNPAAAHV